MKVKGKHPLSQVYGLLLGIGLGGFAIKSPGQAALSVTFTNPVPTKLSFGIAVAACNERMVFICGPGGKVGAYGTSGTLINTFTNPNPSIGFGRPLVRIGPDKLLIGGPSASFSAAYLYNTNGTLLTTFTNPTPSSADGFGTAMAAVGTNKVIIGAYKNDTGGLDAGIAYLYSLDGALLNTFTNPFPPTNFFEGAFGNTVAANDDSVFIKLDKSNRGLACVFSTNGTLITTITNPMSEPNNSFGAISPVGADKLLIIGNGDVSGVNVGCLFSTNGSLLMTIINPYPVQGSDGNGFGYCVTTLGTDKLLIGSFGANALSVPEDNSGAVYIYSTNGALLTTIASPNPGGHFGTAIAAVGTDQMIIGDFYGGGGSFGPPGLAYLFTLQSELQISLTETNTCLVSWTALSTNWTLQSNTDLQTTNWVPVTNAVDNVEDENRVSVDLSEARYFRLTHQ